MTVLAVKAQEKQILGSVAVREAGCEVCKWGQPAVEREFVVQLIILQKCEC